MATREQKKRMILLTVILAVFITAICLTAGVFSDTLANIGGSEAVSAEASRMPVYTYIIGDGTVEAEEGFVYDESTSTYRYKEHATGWTAAIEKAQEIYKQEEKLIKIQLASDWTASVADETYEWIFGKGKGYSNGRLLIDKQNTLLDLNGYDINRNLTQNKGSVIQVKTGILEITDESQGEKYGKITGGYSPNFGGGVDISRDGVLILSEKASIEANKAATSGAGVAAHGTFYMNGGSIINNQVIASYGQGGGIYATGKAFINNGIIEGNQAVYGGGVHNEGGTVTINGGKITGNNVTSLGGGINQNKGTLKLYGGEITNNNANNYGGINIGVITENSVEIAGTPVVINNKKKGTLNAETGIYENGEISNMKGEKVSITGKLSAENSNGEVFKAKIGISEESKLVTTGFSEQNKDENGIVADPTEYFVADISNMYHFFLNIQGEVQYSTVGSLKWTVQGNNDVEIVTDRYGVVISYPDNSIKSIQLVQKTTPIDIALTDSEGQPASFPIENAGTYYATGEVKVDSSLKVKTEFIIKILPFDIENSENPNTAIDGLEYALTADGWGENYELQYDGEAKQAPVVQMTLNGTEFSPVNYAVSYMINDKFVTEIKEVGVYTVVIKGVGNYTGEIYVAQKFTIIPNAGNNYNVAWQYYDNGKWNDFDNALNLLVYNGSAYDKNIRIRLNTSDNAEIRYVYAEGVIDYQLSPDESIDNVTHSLSLDIRGKNTTIQNAGEYIMSLSGTPNYPVEEKDREVQITVHKFNLAELGSQNISISATLDDYQYNTRSKQLTLSIIVNLDGNSIQLGTAGAEYEYTVKYINADGSETEVDSIILGGTYKVYITAVGDNVTGTLGVVGTVTVEKAKNNMTLSSITSWQYGLYDNRLNSFNGTVAMLHDGSITGTERAYIYYTVQNSEGLAVSETLTGFTALSDEVVKAINALGAGSYTVVAEVDGTESYEGATASRTFSVLKANNRWTTDASVFEWNEGEYNEDKDYFYASALHGDVKYTVKDASGNVITDLTIAEAGEYTLTVEVAETADYTGLSHTVNFVIGEKIPAMSAGEIAAVTVLSIIVAGLAGVVAYMLIKRRRT